MPRLVEQANAIYKMGLSQREVDAIENLIETCVAAETKRLRELLLEVLTFPYEYDTNEWAKLMDKLRDATAEDGDGTMP